MRATRAPTMTGLAAEIVVTVTPEHENDTVATTATAIFVIDSHSVYGHKTIDAYFRSPNSVLTPRRSTRLPRRLSRRVSVPSADQPASAHARWQSARPATQLSRYPARAASPPFAGP